MPKAHRNRFFTLLKNSHLARGARAHAQHTPIDRGHTPIERERERERGGPGPGDPPLSLSLYRCVRVRSCTAGQVTSVKNRFRYDLWALRAFLRKNYELLLKYTLAERPPSESRNESQEGRNGVLGVSLESQWRPWAVCETLLGARGSPRWPKRQNLR